MVHRAKAPLRVSFAGGGTDVPPFPEREGGLVLSATINRYAYGALTPRDDGNIRVESVDFGLEVEYEADDPLLFDGKLDLVKAAVRKLGDGTGGYDLFLHANAPPGSGLGSSSTVMVTLIGLLKDFHRLPLTDYEVAELAYTLEREDLGIKGGHQDQYAATFGGFNFMEFGADHVIVNPLRIPPDVIHELEHNMLLAYTGRTRRGDHIIDDQTKRFEGGEEKALEGLRMQKDLAIEMKNALLRRRVTEFGELLGTSWQFKKQMSPRISTDFIDEAYEEAVKHGALGGKVTGAGGGGYMLFFCPFHLKHRVADRLIAMGASVDEFEFTFEGLTTWGFE
ncbi:MAG: GHMP kinase [Actinomycetota bacterium]|nr:GHMP kinase [Actinomycetota bacterium]MDQ5808519.1 GHMP kinase [Actinomycetota bacterium]